MSFAPIVRVRIVFTVTGVLGLSLAHAADYNLSPLPPYKNEQRVQGVFRIWGNDQINLVKAWEVEFKALNYEARFENYLLTTPMLFAGPATGSAEIGYMGHSWWRSDLKGFEAMVGYAHTGMRHFFELRVFQGGDKWNPNYRQYVESGTRMLADGSGIGSQDMLVTLAKDKFGIGWSGHGKAATVPGLKVIVRAPEDSGPYFEPNERNLRTHDYPLSRNVFKYLNRAPGAPLDPELREFLLFVLSAEGQDILVHNGLHLPLTEQTLLTQRKEIE